MSQQIDVAEQARQNASAAVPVMPLTVSANTDTSQRVPRTRSASEPVQTSSLEENYDSVSEGGIKFTFNPREFNHPQEQAEALDRAAKRRKKVRRRRK
jgi:hypothetical protein